MAYITSKTFAIVDSNNAGEARIYDLKTNKILCELRESEQLPLKRVFLSYDETYFLGILDGPKLVKYDLVNKNIDYKINLNDWQDPKYDALEVNDTVTVVYDDYFKDFFSLNTKTGKIIIEDTCDYFYRYSSYSNVWGDNTQMCFTYFHIPDSVRRSPILVNWMTGEKKTSQYNDVFSYRVEQNDTILLRKDFNNKQKCVLYFYNTVTQATDTLYEQYKIDTLFNGGTPSLIFDKNNLMSNSYGDSIFIYSLDKAKKIKKIKIPKFYNLTRYNDESLAFLIEYNPKYTYQIYNTLTDVIENEFSIETNKMPDFYSNKQFLLNYNNGSEILDFINNKSIYSTKNNLLLTINGAFIDYIMTDVGNSNYKQNITYISELDTNIKKSIEYTFTAASYNKAYEKPLKVDVSNDRKHLIYFNHNNYSIMKINFDDNSVDSCLTDTIQDKLFFSKDGKYFQIRNKEKLKIYNYSTNELLISYPISKQYKIISSDYMNYLILYSDTLRSMMCVKFNLDFSTVNNQEYTFTQNLLELYPNPANDIINISAKSNIQIGIIKLFDVNGELIQEINNINTNTLDIDISRLPEGFYYIISNNEIYKFIKIE